MRCGCVSLVCAQTLNNFSGNSSMWERGVTKETREKKKTKEMRWEILVMMEIEVTLTMLITALKRKMVLTWIMSHLQSHYSRQSECFIYFPKWRQRRFGRGRFPWISGNVENLAIPQTQEKRFYTQARTEDRLPLGCNTISGVFKTLYWGAFHASCN